MKSYTFLVMSEFEGKPYQFQMTVEENTIKWTSSKGSAWARGKDFYEVKKWYQDRGAEFKLVGKTENTKIEIRNPGFPEFPKSAKHNPDYIMKIASDGQFEMYCKPFYQDIELLKVRYIIRNGRTILYDVTFSDPSSEPWEKFEEIMKKRSKCTR